MKSPVAGYRTLDDRIDGVVITFADITAAKTLEAQLPEKHAALEKHVAHELTKRAKSRRPAPAVATAGKQARHFKKERRIRKP